MDWRLFRISIPKISSRGNVTRILRDRGGYTAPELIIVAALLSFLIGAIFMPLVTGHFYWHRGESDTQVQRKARYAMEGIIRDLRQVGYGSEGFDYIKQAKADEIKFEADLDNDGSAETVRYFLDGESLKKGIQLEGELNETIYLIINNVSSFNLSYFDRSDPPNEIPLGTDGNVSSANLSEVALIEVDLTTSITRSGYTKQISLNSEALVRR